MRQECREHSSASKPLFDRGQAGSHFQLPPCDLGGQAAKNDGENNRESSGRLFEESVKAGVDLYETFQVRQAHNSDPIAKVLFGCLVNRLIIGSREEACEHNERNGRQYVDCICEE